MRRRKLGLPVGALLELVEESSESNLLNSGVDVEHAVEAGSQDALEVKDTDLSFESGDVMHKTLGRAKNETGHDLFFFDATETETDLLTALGNGNLIFGLAVDSRNIDRLLVGHHDQAHTLLDHTGLDLTLNHGTHITVLASNGHHEGGVDLALEGVHVIEVLEQRGAIVPGADILGDAVLDTQGLLGSDGHEENIRLKVVTSTLQELSKLGRALLIALLGPVDGRVVHLVDDNDELVDTLGLGQHGVLTGLTALLETGLVLTLTGGDDEDTDIGLGSTTNHVGDIGLVAGGIENGVLALVGLEETATNLDSLTLGTLLVGQIKSPREVPGLTTHLLSFPLVLVEGTLVNHAGDVENGTTEGRLAGIDVTNEDNVHMLLAVDFLEGLVVNIGGLNLLLNSIDLANNLGAGVSGRRAGAAGRGSGRSLAARSSRFGLLDGLGSSNLGGGLSGTLLLSSVLLGLLLLGCLLGGSSAADGENLGGGLGGITTDAQNLGRSIASDAENLGSLGGLGLWLRLGSGLLWPLDDLRSWLGGIAVLLLPLLVSLVLLVATILLLLA